MTKGLKACGLLLMATTVIACGGMAGIERRDMSSPDPVLGMLNRGILQLTMNIEALTERMAELRQFPDTTDPILQTLRVLDLSGWELHQQQWLIQRDHLRFAKEGLLQAKEHPQEKPRLLREWTTHEKQYESLLDDFRQQRHALDQKRLRVEAQLVERSLR